MKIHNIYVKQGLNLEDLELIDESSIITIAEKFSFKALVFGIFWTIYKKLWLASLALLTLQIMVAFLTSKKLVASEVGMILDLCGNLYVGFNGQKMLMRKLENSNTHELSKVITAKSEPEALVTFLREEESDAKHKSM